MGTGKTASGKILARKLKTVFIDLDELIEKDQKRSINDIFEKEGEAYFRLLEYQQLEEFSRKDNLVVSCGGGIVINNENIVLMKKTGTIISLTSTPEAIFARVKNQAHRPLLKVGDPLAKIKELLLARAPFYGQADKTIDASLLTPEQAADKILEEIKKMPKL